MTYDMLNTTAPCIPEFINEKQKQKEKEKEKEKEKQKKELLKEQV